jgi:hypothetical protein
VQVDHDRTLLVVGAGREHVDVEAVLESIL